MAFSLIRADIAFNVTYNLLNSTAMMDAVQDQLIALWYEYSMCCKYQESWWRYQMETLSALLAICAGNSPVTGEFPAQSLGTWRGALMFSLIGVWMNGWVNNREAGDLRRYRAHYDVIVRWITRFACVLFLSGLINEYRFLFNGVCSCTVLSYCTVWFNSLSRLTKMKTSKLCITGS